MKQPARPVFKLQIEERTLGALATRYDLEQADDLDESFVQRVRGQGFLTRCDLEDMAKWKSPRIVPSIRRNDEDDVREITSICFAARGERVRIDVLTVLYGVGYPMASVLLHFFHKEPYPLLDFRALAALGVEEPSSYSFDFWIEYVEVCRRLSVRTGLDMRALDKALWQWSKEQGRA